VTGREPYRVNVTTGVSERYGAVLFPRKSLLAGTGASTPVPPGGVQSGVHLCDGADARSNNSLGRAYDAGEIDVSGRALATRK
jgi:hypothetical protein